MRTASDMWESVSAASGALSTPEGIQMLHESVDTSRGELTTLAVIATTVLPGAGAGAPPKERDAFWCAFGIQMGVVIASEAFNR